MKLRASLPLNREDEGRFWVLDDEGSAIFGPVRCRGEADNTNALHAENPIEDPTRIGGDFPFGVYLVGECVQDPKPWHTYGPWFIRLSPVSGEALDAWIAGRRGIGAHGGELGPGSILRATFGCLRLDNETTEHVVKYLVAEKAAGRQVFLESVPMTP